MRHPQEESLRRACRINPQRPIYPLLFSESVACLTADFKISIVTLLLEIESSLGLHVHGHMWCKTAQNLTDPNLLLQSVTEIVQRPKSANQDAQKSA